MAEFQTASFKSGLVSARKTFQPLFPDSCPGLVSSREVRADLRGEAVYYASP